jgi:hypothetical protein
MTHTPGPISVAAGDEGGPLINGGVHPGTITPGDLDVWTITASAGNLLTVQISQTSELSDFTPWIRLWGPGGTTHGDTFGFDTATFTSAALPASGTYLILVASADSGLDGSGTYNLTVSGATNDTAGLWRGGTGQLPTQGIDIYVNDASGVVGITTTALASPCAPLPIAIDLLPPQAITSNSFSVNFSFASGFGTIAGNFTDATHASGTMLVDFNAISGCPDVNTTWTATKLNTDPIPILSVVASDPDASEVASDDGVFTITRVGATTAALSFTYTITGTATNDGSDYTLLSGGATIAAGQASVNVTVNPVNDGLVEGPQTVVLTLNDRPHYNLNAPTSATVTIADLPTPLVTVSATDATASESPVQTGTFTFTRSGDTSAALTVSYTIGGNATHITDYGQIFSPITIPIGQASATRTVTPVNDGVLDGPETVIVTLTDGANYDLGSPSDATVTITDTP